MWEHEIRSSCLGSLVCISTSTGDLEKLLEESLTEHLATISNFSADDGEEKVDMACLRKAELRVMRSTLRAPFEAVPDIISLSTGGHGRGIVARIAQSL